MVVKLIGLGFSTYIKDRFNIFDAVIVMLSIVDVSLSYSPNGGTGGAISAFRAFRLLRVFKLAKSWKKFHELLRTIGNTLKDISNFSILLFLFMFTYNLLGLELFANKVKFNDADEVDLERGSSPRINFDTFLNGFTCIFIILTGEDWN